MYYLLLKPGYPPRFVKEGFSFTALFFGPFPFLFRGMPLYFLIGFLSLLGLESLGEQMVVNGAASGWEYLGWSVNVFLAFTINNMTLHRLLATGYQISDQGLGGMLRSMYAHQQAQAQGFGAPAQPAEEGEIELTQDPAGAWSPKPKPAPIRPPQTNWWNAIAWVLVILLLVGLVIQNFQEEPSSLDPADPPQTITQPLEPGEAL